MAREEVERRALMRRIWRMNLDTPEGLNRLQGTREPWLIENFYDLHSGYFADDIRVRFKPKRSLAKLPKWERVQRFRQSIPYLYNQAKIARDKAMSYRGFNVGVSVLAFKAWADHETAWKAFAGTNTKHAPNMRPTCAEPIAINSAYLEDFSLIVGIVVVGELREEDLGHILTLHPCHDCRWFMHGHPLIDRHTLVLTARPGLHNFNHAERRPSTVWLGPDSKKYEIRTIGRLLQLHRKISGDDFT